MTTTRFSTITITSHIDVTGDGCTTSYNDDDDTLRYDDYFINISRDGYTTSYDDDDDTLRYNDYFINISRDGCTTSYDDDDDDYNCFVPSFQGTGISNDNDDDKLFLSATYQN